MLLALQEFEVQRIGRNLLEKSFGEIKEAICRLSEMKRLLEHDWSDKQETAQIDHTAARLQLKDNIAQFKVLKCQVLGEVTRS